MNFTRFKYLYLIIILCGTIVYFVLNSPLYEVVVDIALSPPENIRKTDFSWITVNEWFTSQAYIITSHSILKDVNSDFSESKLKRIVHAKRLGASDIIRISVRSEDNPEKLLKLAGDIAIVYLQGFHRETNLTAAVVRSSKEEAAEEANLSPYNAEINKKSVDALYEERTKVVEATRRFSEISKSYELKLAKIDSELKKMDIMNDRIRQIDNELSSSSQRVTKLREVYTENWPEVVSLNEKIRLLTREKEILAPGVASYDKLARQKLEIKTQIDVAEENLSVLKEQSSYINKRIGNLINASPAAEAITVKPKDIISELSQKITDEPTEIINPPTVNFLPDLGIQLAYGVISGYALWFLLCLLFSRIEVRKVSRPASG